VKLKNGGTDPAYLIGRFIGAVLSEPMREAVHKERIRALEAELAEAKGLHHDAVTHFMRMQQERDAALAKLETAMELHDSSEEQREEDAEADGETLTKLRRLLKQARAEAEALRAHLSRCHPNGQGCAFELDERHRAKARLAPAPAPKEDSE